MFDGLCGPYMCLSMCACVEFTTVSDALCVCVCVCVCLFMHACVEFTIVSDALSILVCVCACMHAGAHHSI